MAATSSRQWGVTPPIISALPTDAEIATNDALIAELKQQNNFESSDETEKRYVSLACRGEHALNAILQEEHPPFDSKGYRRVCQAGQQEEKRIVRSSCWCCWR